METNRIQQILTIITIRFTVCYRKVTHTVLSWQTKPFKKSKPEPIYYVHKVLTVSEFSFPLTE